MKVLLIFHHLRYAEERGGQRSREVAETLAKRGHDVTALVPNIDPLTQRKAINRIAGLWAERPGNRSYREIRYKVPATARAGLAGRAMYSVVALCNTMLFALMSCRQFQVIAVTSHPLPIAFSALPYRIVRGAKLIVEIRDVPVDVAVERGMVRKNGTLYRTYKWLEHRLIGMSDAVIGYSRGMLDIAGAFNAKANWYVIPIGVDARRTELFDNEKWSADATIRVCFFGTLGEVINLDPIFEFLRLFRERGVKASLDVYGAGEKKERLMTKVAEDGLPVYFKGLVSRGAVPEVCARYDFAAYPIEGGPAVSASLGNKFFDYLAAGTPMIVIGVNSEPGRLVEQYSLGISADSAEELVGRVSLVLEKCLARNGTIRSEFKVMEARDVFDKQRLLDKWADVLESCA